jgi:hypothetical protein
MHKPEVIDQGYRRRNQVTNGSFQNGEPDYTPPALLMLAPAAVPFNYELSTKALSNDMIGGLGVGWIC